MRCPKVFDWWIPVFRVGMSLWCLYVFVIAISGSSTTEKMFHLKVLISNPTVPRIAYDLLASKFQVITSSSHDRASILQDVRGVDALFWASHNSIDKEILDAAGPQLKVIGTMSVGYDHIDLKEVKARGIKLSNTPDVLNDAVADIAMLLALTAARRFPEGRQHIEKGTWSKEFDTQWMLGQDITGSTIGIVGLGRIGQTIAKRLQGFSVQKVLYTGHREKPQAKDLGYEFVNLDELTSGSDFIFLSAPLTNETMHMCNEAFFSKMKKNAILINVSRGQLVDQEALIAALKTGQISAAGLDVVTPEPLNIDSELLKLPNVVLTPHIGSATRRTTNAMARLTSQNILAGLAGHKLISPVHLP